MEKINVSQLLEKHRVFDKSPGGFLAYAICTLVNNEIIQDGQSKTVGPENFLFFDIEVTINGFPVKFSKLIETLCECFNKNVHDKAKELFEDRLRTRFGDILDRVQDVEKRFQDEVQKIFAEEVDACEEAQHSSSDNRR